MAVYRVKWRSAPPIIDRNVAKSMRAQGSKKLTIVQTGRRNRWRAYGFVALTFITSGCGAQFDKLLRQIGNQVSGGIDPNTISQEILDAINSALAGIGNPVSGPEGNTTPTPNPNPGTTGGGRPAIGPANPPLVTDTPGSSGTPNPANPVSSALSPLRQKYPEAFPLLEANRALTADEKVKLSNALFSSGLMEDLANLDWQDAKKILQPLAQRILHETEGILQTQWDSNYDLYDINDDYFHLNMNANHLGGVHWIVSQYKAMGIANSEVLSIFPLVQMERIVGKSLKLAINALDAGSNMQNWSPALDNELDIAWAKIDEGDVPTAATRYQNFAWPDIARLPEVNRQSGFRVANVGRTAEAAKDLTGIYLTLFGS